LTARIPGFHPLIRAYFGPFSSLASGEKGHIADGAFNGWKCIPVIGFEGHDSDEPRSSGRAGVPTRWLKAEPSPVVPLFKIVLYFAECLAAIGLRIRN